MTPIPVLPAPKVDQFSPHSATAAPRGSSIKLEEMRKMAFEVPALSYPYEALEPYIDSQTMHLHHDKHHQAYVNNANAAVTKAAELAGKSAEELLANLSAVPEAVRGAVRNNVGGHVNHSMFWSIMGPNAGGEPTGAIGDAIKSAFGDFAQFQEKFNDAGLKQFGSGWAWLALGSGGLQVLATPNQDSPLSQGLKPILGNDVWEHAYYLKYQNRRADYLKAWWNVVNWAEVNKRYEAALK
jgi:Fe-Mn family superoxide dismutase